MSADPMGLGSADPTDPQTMNAYAYVRNSPTSLVDPLGLCGGQGLPCPDVTSVTVDGGCPPGTIGRPIAIDGGEMLDCSGNTDINILEEQYAINAGISLQLQCGGGACGPGGTGGGGSGNGNTGPTARKPLATQTATCSSIQQQYDKAAHANLAKWWGRFYGSIFIGTAVAGPAGGVGAGLIALLNDESSSDYWNIYGQYSQTWQQAGCPGNLQRMD
jgi:hypothetical protein